MEKEQKTKELKANTPMATGRPAERMLLVP